MDANRVYGLLATASSEITMLRRQVDTLRPKAEAYDVIARMWRDPGKENAWGVDVHFELQRAMEEIHTGFQREKGSTDKPESVERNYAGQEDFGDAREDARTLNRSRSTAAANMSGVGMRIDEADRPD